MTLSCIVINVWTISTRITSAVHQTTVSRHRPAWDHHAVSSLDEIWASSQAEYSRINGLPLNQTHRARVGRSEAGSDFLRVRGCGIDCKAHSRLVINVCNRHSGDSGSCCCISAYIGLQKCFTTVVKIDFNTLNESVWGRDVVRDVADACSINCSVYFILPVLDCLHCGTDR